MENFLVENRIRQFRMKRGLAQWKLALATRISESRMCTLEQGAPPRPKEVTKLVSFFGLRSEEIWPQGGLDR